MDEQDLKKRLPQAIDSRLSALESNPFLAQRIINAEKGENPPMKKKISVSLIFVLVLTILSLGAAAALVHSQIADKLYETEGDIPKEVLNQIQTPNSIAQSALGIITLDEIYYDGNDLHTIITLENPTEETLLYTMDGFFINGMAASGNNLFSEGPGSYGRLLGGSVENKKLPASSSYYERWQQLVDTNEQGKFQGWLDIPKGKISLKILVDVWRPLNNPKLVNYNDFEGYDVTDTMNCLVTDEDGDCDLEMFRPENARRNYTLGQSGGAVYEAVFKELGWAERIDTIQLEMEVDLDQILVSRAVPEKMKYSFQGFDITFDAFELTHGGGKLEGWIAGDYSKVNSFLSKGLVLVDRQGDRDLSRGCTWTSQTDDEKGVSFTILLSPISGNLPTRVYLAQPLAYNDQFMEGYPHFDPTLKKPENIIGTWELDFDAALEIKLNIVK